MSSIEKIVAEVLKQRAKVIDDFCKVYVAARYDWFMENPKRLTRIELVEQRTSDGLGVIYRVRVKPGRRKV